MTASATPENYTTLTDVTLQRCTLKLSAVEKRHSEVSIIKRGAFKIRRVEVCPLQVPKLERGAL